MTGEHDQAREHEVLHPRAGCRQQWLDCTRVTTADKGLHLDAREQRRAPRGEPFDDADNRIDHAQCDRGRGIAPQQRAGFDHRIAWDRGVRKQTLPGQALAREYEAAEVVTAGIDEIDRHRAAGVDDTKRSTAAGTRGDHRQDAIDPQLARPTIAGTNPGHGICRRHQADRQPALTAYRLDQPGGACCTQYARQQDTPGASPPCTQRCAESTLVGIHTRADILQLSTAHHGDLPTRVAEIDQDCAHTTTDLRKLTSPA